MRKPETPDQTIAPVPGMHTFSSDDAESSGAFTEDAITAEEAQASLVDLKDGADG